MTRSDETAEQRLACSDEVRPVFSIVTPSFNQGKYLQDALSSVQRQGGMTFEHLVFDGGSTDESREVLEVAPESVRYVIENDKGQSDALNKGFRKARGEIIGWLNADDFYLPGAFEAVERYFALHPRIQVVYGDAVVVDESGCVIRGLQQHRFDFKTLLYYNCFVPSTSTFFRSGLASSGMLHLDRSLHTTMDLELFLRLASEGVVFGYLPRDLAAFRWHQAAKTWGYTREGADEKTRVQRMYGARNKGVRTLRALYRTYELKHGALKLSAIK